MRLLLSLILLLLLVTLGSTIVLLYNLQPEMDRRYQVQGQRLATAEAEVARLEQRLRTMRRQLKVAQEDSEQTRLELKELRRLLAETDQETPTSPEPARKASVEERRQHILQTRQVMESLNQGLRRAGYSRMRLFALEKVGKDHLVDVSLHLLGPHGIVSEAFRLERLYFTLEEETSTLHLFAPRGRICSEGAWSDLGPKGWSRILEGVPFTIWPATRCAFIRRLPAPPKPEKKDDPTREERSLLRDRLNALLGTTPGFQGRLYRLRTLGRLLPGAFGQIDLLGYSPKGLLLERLKAEKLVLLATPGGGMKLVLTEGFRSFSGGRQDFPPAGYVLLLPRAEVAAWRKSFPGRIFGKTR